MTRTMSVESLKKRSSPSFFFLEALLIMLFSASLPLRAQDITGSITGIVTDPAKRVMPNVEVTVVSTERGLTRTVRTNGQGQFFFAQLPVGLYNLMANAPGFEGYVNQGIPVDAASSITENVAMVLGKAEISVVVNASDVPVDTTSAVIGTLFDKKTVEEMPLLGNNVVGLAILLPGVAAINVNAPTSFTRSTTGPTFTINGARAGQNLYLLDGVYFNNLYRNTGLNYPPPESVAEIQVLTNNYQAEYGHNAGAIFSVITKSGTNAYHGGMWEYFQNPYLDARIGYPGFSTNYQASISGLNKSNQFGGGLGGPILHGKLFFEASYQGYRRPNSLLGTANEFTAYTGPTSPASFSSTITDPSPAGTTCAPIANNTIPACRFDPTAVALIAAFNLGGTATQLHTTASNPNDNNLGIIRFDYNRGRHAIDGRFYVINSSDITPQGNVLTYDAEGNKSLVIVNSATDTFVLSPNKLNVAHIAYKRFHNPANPQDHRTLQNFGSNFPDYGAPTLPYISVGGFVSLSYPSNAAENNVEQTFEINDQILITRGAHNIKFGGNYLQQEYNSLSNNRTQGEFFFNSGTPGINSVTGNAEADFLIGRPTSVQVVGPALIQDGKQQNLYLYAQDTWRISNRITLDAGLRYELPFPWYDPNNRWGTFREGQQSTRFPTAPAGLVFPGDAGIQRGMVKTDYNNVAPRLGIAWNVTGDGKLIARAGGGVFFDALNAGIVQSVDQPFQYFLTYNNVKSLSDPLAGQVVIPTQTSSSSPTFISPPSLAFLDKNMTTPYVFQYNLGIQKAYPRSLVLEANYVGRQGRKLYQAYSFNPAIYGPGATTSNTDSRRRIQGFSDLEDQATIGSSTYNALQIKATKRTQTINVNGSFTWSRSIDTLSAYNSEGANFPQPFNLRANRGPSDFNTDLVGTLGYVVSLPALKRQKAFIRLILGGWQYSGTYQIATGVPINVTLTVDQALTAVPLQRPNQSGSAQLPSKRSRMAKTDNPGWFNTAVFSLPAIGTYGNAGRNSVIGPAAITNNMAVNKSWTLRKSSQSLNLRLDAFGAFNTPNIGDVGVGGTATQFGSSDFGQSSFYTGNRQLQISARFKF